MFERYTEKARRTIFFARYEASQFGSPFIEAEHILLGVLREDRQLAVQVLGKGTPSESALPGEVAQYEFRLKELVRRMESAIAARDFVKTRELADEERRERANFQRLREKHFLFAGDHVDAIRAEIEAASKKGEKVPTSADLPLSHGGKQVLVSAAEEAQQMGQRHIGTPHLFLGLLRQEDVLAAKVLRKRGVELAAVREIARASGPDDAPPGASSSFGQQGESEQRSPGRPGPRSPGHRFSARAQRAFSLARYHAAELGSPIIDTEHLLLGLFEESPDLGTLFFGGTPVPNDPAIAGEILEAEKRVAAVEARITEAILVHQFAAARAGSAELLTERVYLEQLRKRIFESIRSEVRDSAPVRERISAADLPLSPALKAVMRYGAEEAERLNHRMVGSEHLLAGVLREESSPAAQILARRGVKLSYVREVLSRSGLQPPPAGPQEGRDYV